MLLTWLAMWLLVLAVGAAVAPRMVANYTGRLPYAPECPACHAVTSQTARHPLADRLCALIDATPVRTCTRCGWAGRMRWRLAPERIRGRG
ncbi:MAG TPA: hypothetical protein VEX86_22225 [Longimicrobium sp.]|nr:hypothetical protein [Longimicrobium sp.]